MTWWNRWKDDPPMPTLPERPRDVFITKGDTGERIPCELAYNGLGDTEDGEMHMWAVLTECRPGRDTISIGYMPSYSSICFALDAEPFALGEFDIEINGTAIPFSEDM